MRKIDKIIVHCSDSEFGSARLIDQWHKERGFDSIGYHYVIQNGISAARGARRAESDGKLETGRPIDLPGAHCRGENESSIGVCLIGKNDFTTAQFKTLAELISRLRKDYGVPAKAVRGHCETASGKNQGKTCPNFDMASFREKLGNAADPADKAD